MNTNLFTQQLYKLYLSIPIEELQSRSYSLIMPDDIFVGEQNPPRKPFRHLFEDEFLIELEKELT